MSSLAIGFALHSSFCFAFMGVLFWERQGSYIGWFIYSGGRVEAVAAGSNCWVGCGGLYGLGCHGSLALINEKGEAGGASAGGTCADGACTGGACGDGACRCALAHKVNSKTS
jgi:hypothetical protein